IFINDKQVAEGRFEKSVAARFWIDDTFYIGQDTCTPVVDSYQVPFKFTGNLEQLKVDLL
ncbi:MAG: hypothetical protein ACK571_07820, partial [Pseudanabaena sp.]